MSGFFFFIIRKRKVFPLCLCQINILKVELKPFYFPTLKHFICFVYKIKFILTGFCHHLKVFTKWYNCVFLVLFLKICCQSSNFYLKCHLHSFAYAVPTPQSISLFLDILYLHPLKVKIIWDNIYSVLTFMQQEKKEIYIPIDYFTHKQTLEG